MPARVVRHVGVEAELHEAEVGGRELPGGRVAVGLAVGRELLEVGDLAHVDLRREVPPDRRPRASRPGRAARRAAPTRSRYGSRARCQSSTWSEPSRTWSTTREGRVARSGRLADQFTTHSQKLAHPGEQRGDRDEADHVRGSLAFAAVAASEPLLAAGCGGDDESTATETERRRRRASRSALVADAGQLNDNGFNELAFKGLKRAERELGITGRVVEAKSAADYVPNMSTLARQGFDLIIGVGFAQGDAIAATAKRFPETNFAIVDVDQAFLKGKPAERPGPAVPRGAGRLPRRLPRRARGEARGRRRRSAPSAASRSLRSTASSPATRRAPRRRCRARRCAGTTRRTGTTRRSARSSRSTRSRPARRSCSRSRAAAGSARSRPRRTRRCGGSASTATSRSSARTC